MSKSQSTFRLGVITHDYLKEPYIKALESANIAVVPIIPAGALGLSLQADQVIVIPSLDSPKEEIEKAIAEAEKRGIFLNGLISLRDGNVLACAEICKNKGWIGPFPESLKPVVDKKDMREYLRNNPISNLKQCEYKSFPRGLDESSFKTEFSEFFNSLSQKKAVFKPTKGSCKAHVILVDGEEKINHAYETYKTHSNYRGGEFIVEEFIEGEEFSVETVVDNNGNIVWQGITGYIQREANDHNCYEIGHYTSSLGHFANNPELQKKILSVVTDLHKELGLQSMITHVEMKTQDGKIALIEFYPRAGGDLILHLHSLATGISPLYLLAGIVSGQTVLTEETSSVCEAAIIRFFAPQSGILHTHICECSGLLKSPEDKICTIAADGAILFGGNTNDDRPGFVLLAGDNVEELLNRSALIASKAVSFEGYPYFLKPI
jgi:biotin carboxylase